MNIRSIVFSSIILAGVLLVSCKDGEIGPEGPKGDTGATGATGAAGPKGDKGAIGDPGDPGTKGNFNIIVKKMDGGEITAGTNGAGYSWWWSGGDLPAELVENSAVYVYLLAENGVWYVLPGDVWSVASNGWHNFALRIHFEDNRTLTRIRITRTKGTGNLKFTAASILIVPRAAGARQANVDYSDYHVVKELYNLED